MSIPKYYQAVSNLKEAITTGTMLAIDPSSGSKDSDPGYALYKRGVLVESGIIDIDPDQPIQSRLHDLAECLAKEFKKIDVLVIERIGGWRAHQFLLWSVGVTVATMDLPYVELPPQVWKQYIPHDYEKTDQHDAEAIGQAALEICKEL